jgi:hypothetical protein
MHQTLKLVHIFGLIIFLGSIFTFILISVLGKSAGLELVAYGRKIISTGTYTLTLVGMWMIAISGICMGYKGCNAKKRFLQIKLLLAALIMLNAYLFIVPAMNTATELATKSLLLGKLIPEYSGAYLRESIFGALNIILVTAAAVVGVWKIGGESLISE